MKHNLRYVIPFFCLLHNPLCWADQSYEQLHKQATAAFYNKDFVTAYKLFDDVIKKNPHCATAYFNKGILFKQDQQLDEAITAFKKALTCDPQYARAYFHLGDIATHYKNHATAYDYYTQAAQHAPLWYDAHYLRGQAAMALGNYTDAIAHFATTITLRPYDIQPYFSKAYALIKADQILQACTVYDAVLEQHPQYIRAWYNKGYALKLSGNMHEAINYYKNVITHEPTYEQAYLGLAKCLLATGNFEDGWRYFEWRWNNTQQALKAFDHHTITPDDLDGKTVFIRAEWGLGDSMQFIRYVQLLKNYGAQVIVQTFGSLVPLFSRCPYIDQVIPVNSYAPTYDYQIPLLSLPLFFNITEETIPSTIPYLHAQPELVALWKQRLATDTNFKIGICWHGKQNIFLEEHPRTRRSIPLTVFEPLMNIPGVSIYSLQYGEGANQISNLIHPEKLHTFEGDFDKTNGRFMDTAAVITNLDLVISVDTSIVHLSGALGTPVWVLLPQVAEWRWMQERTDTPWYPNMRLFRQTIYGDWNHTMQEVIHEVIATINPLERS